MKDFVIVLISVALLNGAFGMLSPDGDLKKYIKLLGSLCLVCAVASPIFSAIKADGGGFDGLFPDASEDQGGYEEIYGEALADGAEETLERILKERAVTDLEIKEDEIDFDVALERTDGEYGISDVTVYIHHGGIFVDPRSITALVNEFCDVSCTVIYD